MSKPDKELSRESKRGFDEISSLFDKKKKANQQRDERSHSSNTSTQQQQRQKKTHPKTKTGWVEDGLGGVYNTEGFTGRVEDGVKIFKAHVLNKPKAGSTPQCPFDCDCCFI
jgi:hypothetical protein